MEWKWCTPIKEHFIPLLRHVWSAATGLRHTIDYAILEQWMCISGLRPSWFARMELGLRLGNLQYTWCALQIKQRVATTARVGNGTLFLLTKWGPHLKIMASLRPLTNGTNSLLLPPWCIYAYDKEINFCSPVFLLNLIPFCFFIVCLEPIIVFNLHSIYK